MDTRQLIGIALIVGGVMLVVFGLNAQNSFASDLSEMVTGSPTDRSIWMLISGAVATVAGGLLTLGALGRS